VNRNVTTPEEAAAADTLTGFHTDHGATSNIIGIRLGTSTSVWAALAMTTPGPTESPSHGYRSRFVQGR
jgi:hypothetical protein